MNILKVIDEKKAELEQQYSDLEKQEANINAEKLRLQGEHRAYEFIKTEKEKSDATDSKKPRKRRRTSN